MGERGPVALPTALKRAQGTLRPARELPDGDEVQPETLADMPRGMSTGAQREWIRLAPELERLGLLTGNDVAAFQMYAENYATWRTAMRKVKSEGMFVGGRPNPAIRVANEAAALARTFLREFGLSPSARARLKGNPKTASKTAEDFLFGSRLG